MGMERSIMPGKQAVKIGRQYTKQRVKQGILIVSLCKFSLPAAF
ncbi:hypothetical protein HMPREF9371_1838 [Neisseria shayeganii 871]|uniref:Uncharacterized protein n=1 Tax=Neisseria shayeganii 871 TaxID=1032488 RepID=G4CJP8_9NEIS|nr:hypothetical protein HMPREF9371_1838 [Neisseria shayeganii 871]